MTEVAIYTAMSCPYCLRAKRLLAQKGVPYREIDVTTDDALREKMIAESGRRTVPQIFIDGRPIGGYDELAALEQSGKLDAMLESRSGAD